MSDVQITTYETREAWLAGRTAGIGASESAALFGLSPWNSETSLWCEKTGLVQPIDQKDEHVGWGTLLETGIAQGYGEATKRVVWSPGTPWNVAQHPRLACMLASVDRWVIEARDREGRGVLELKNVDMSQAHLWENGPPDYYEVQVQHQLAVTGFRWGSIAGLIGGNRLKYFDIERNDAFIEELETRVVEFWDMVERRIQPAPDAHAATTRALKRLHPMDNGAAVTLTEAELSAWDELENAKHALKRAEEEKQGAENRLRAAIGAATFGLLPDGRLLSLKHRSVKGYTTNVEPRIERRLQLEKKRIDMTKTMSEALAASSFGKGAR